MLEFIEAAHKSAGDGDEEGEGDPLVFVHGLLVNGSLWRKVAPARHAGATPKITPERIATPAAKSSTEGRSELESPSATPLAEAKCTRALLIQLAMTRPTKAPSPDSRHDSMTNCRTRRHRLAPSVRRRATSFCLAAPRAVCSAATLAQAITRTSPTMAISVSSC